jgi:uncharacterized protein (TIGR02722 family)
MRTLFSWTLPALSLAVLIALGGCAEKRVARVDTGKQLDLSGKWNDTDSQMVSKDMIADALSFPWADQFSKKNGRNPVVVAFGVKNRTAELINTQTFMKDLERSFLRSGRVDVVADRDQRSELREERADQQGGFTANPAKIGKEVGADFVLTGTINSIQDRLDNNEVIFYQTNLELVNVESNQKVWIGENKIKKLIDRAKTRF